MATLAISSRFRDRMLNIPDRVAAMLAAETDATRCYEILDTEIGEALTRSAKVIGSAATTARTRWDPFPNDLAVGATHHRCTCLRG